MAQRLSQTKSRMVELFCCLALGCALVPGQRLADLTTPTPLAPGDILVLGFLGGREDWDNPKRSVRQLCLKLRGMQLARTYVETIENKERELALQLVVRAYDQDGNGHLEREEAAAARILIYGQSFGGAAVVKLARELCAIGVPVELTVQVDSVGIGDEEIPPNVRRAANLYQPNGWFVKGEKRIRAVNPALTTILGNFEYDYAGKRVDLSRVAWHKKIMRVAHARMEVDPEVWTQVEALILATLAELEH